MVMVVVRGREAFPLFLAFYSMSKIGFEISDSNLGLLPRAADNRGHSERRTRQPNPKNRLGVAWNPISDGNFRGPKGLQTKSSGSRRKKGSECRFVCSNYYTSEETFHYYNCTYTFHHCRTRPTRYNDHLRMTHSGCAATRR